MVARVLRLAAAVACLLAAGVAGAKKKEASATLAPAETEGPMQLVLGGGDFAILKTHLLEEFPLLQDSAVELGYAGPRLSGHPPTYQDVATGRLNFVMAVRVTLSDAVTEDLVLKWFWSQAKMTHIEPWYALAVFTRGNRQEHAVRRSMQMYRKTAKVAADVTVRALKTFYPAEAGVELAIREHDASVTRREVDLQRAGGGTSRAALHTRESPGLVLGGGPFLELRAYLQEKFPQLKRVDPGYVGGYDTHPKYDSVMHGVTGHALAVAIPMDQGVNASDIFTAFFERFNPFEAPPRTRPTEFRTIAVVYSPDMDLGLREALSAFLDTHPAHRERHLMMQVLHFSRFFPAEHNITEVVAVVDKKIAQAREEFRRIQQDARAAAEGDPKRGNALLAFDKLTGKQGSAGKGAKAEDKPDEVFGTGAVVSKYGFKTLQERRVAYVERMRETMGTRINARDPKAPQPTRGPLNAGERAARLKYLHEKFGKNDVIPTQAPAEGGDKPEGTAGVDDKATVKYGKNLKKKKKAPAKSGEEAKVERLEKTDEAAVKADAFKNAQLQKAKKSQKSKNVVADDSGAGEAKQKKSTEGAVDGKAGEIEKLQVLLDEAQALKARVAAKEETGADADDAAKSKGSADAKADAEEKVQADKEAKSKSKTTLMVAAEGVGSGVGGAGGAQDDANVGKQSGTVSKTGGVGGSAVVEGGEAEKEKEEEEAKKDVEEGSGTQEASEDSGGKNVGSKTRSEAAEGSGEEGSDGKEKSKSLDLSAANARDGSVADKEDAAGSEEGDSGDEDGSDEGSEDDSDDDDSGSAAADDAADAAAAVDKNAQEGRGQAIAQILKSRRAKRQP